VSSLSQAAGEPPRAIALLGITDAFPPENFYGGTAFSTFPDFYGGTSI